MFCTKCGKELHEGDQFCGNCGAKVREAEKPPVHTYHDVVFNPPFKQEAEKRTSQIFSEFESGDQQRKTDEGSIFNWNLDGFPSAEPRKTEDVNFNWDSVMEGRNRIRSVENDEDRPAEEDAAAVEETAAEEPGEESESETEEVVVDKIEIYEQRTEELHAEEENLHEEGETPDRGDAQKADEESSEEEPLSIDELESEIFEKEYTAPASRGMGDSDQNTAQLEKFYTYNEKKEAFQELLDREYERLKGMEEANQPDSESLEYTWAGRLFPERKRAVDNGVLQSGNELEEAGEAAEEMKSADVNPTVDTEPSADTDKSGDVTRDFSAVREALRQQKTEDEEDDAFEEAFAEEFEIGQNTEAEAVENANENENEDEHEGEDGRSPVTGEAEPPCFGGETIAADHVGEGVSDNGSSDTAAAESAEEQQPAQDIGAISESDDEEPQQYAGIEKMILEAENTASKKKKSSGTNLALRIIIGILIAALCIEVIILIVRFAAPDSTFAVRTNQVISSILGRLGGT